MDIREQFNWRASNVRRRMAEDKRELYNGEHLATLHALIKSRIADKVTGAQIVKWANTSRNLCRQITRTVATPYSRGCVRDLSRGNPSDKHKLAFAEVVAESKMPQVATLIAAYAWLLGPTLVIPQLAGDGTYYLDLIPPSHYEAILKSPSEVADVLFQRGDGLLVRVSPDAFEYYDAKGEPAKGFAPVHHGLGYVPAAIFRSNHWTGDWFNRWDHRALVDASYDVSMADALLNWSRKQSGKQLLISGDIKAMAGKQPTGNPDRPLYFNTPTGTDHPKWDVLDLESASVTNWINVIQNKIAGVCELYGLPPIVITGTNGSEDWGQVGLARAPEVLDALRDELIPWMRDGEKQLWPIVCDMLRASPRMGFAHEHANDLPPGDEVRGMLALRFLEPIPDAKRKIARLDLFEREEALGLRCVTDLVIEDRPELSREEADALIAENLTQRLRRHDALAARNIPAGTAAAVESIAQAQGRIGGLTKADNAAQAEQIE